MFQFPWFPLPALCVQAGVTPHDGCRVSPFGHPRINAWSAAPRGFSQPPTSFIGSRRQGIHRWLFVAWKNKDARARYAILKEPASSRNMRRQHPGRETAHLENGTADDQCTNWESPLEWRGRNLLRKEVIQPHLPVRLPCYDFTPIADPTFDSSLPKGWATGFGCYRLSWCDGRCVQGPGTYSPRRS
jgi:hypothetical protein